MDRWIFFEHYTILTFIIKIDQERARYDPHYRVRRENNTPTLRLIIIIMIISLVECPQLDIDLRSPRLEAARIHREPAV